MKNREGLLVYFTIGCFLVVFGILGTISWIYRKATEGRGGNGRK